MSSTMQYKAENENCSTNLHLESYIKEEILFLDMKESYIKEEIALPDMKESNIKEEIIMFPDMTEFDKESKVVNNKLRTDVIPFVRLYRIENKVASVEQIHSQHNSSFDVEKDVVNVNEKNEKIFVETHKMKDISGNKELNNIETDNFDNNLIRIDQCNIKMEGGVTSNDGALLLDMSGYSDEKYTQKSTRKTRNLKVDTHLMEKENVKPKQNLNKKECSKSLKQFVMSNYYKKPSTRSSKLSTATNNTPKDIVDKVIFQSTVKEDNLNTMILVCPKCSRKRMVRRTRHVVTICRNCNEPMIYDKQKTYQCKQCIYQSNSGVHFRRHVRQHSVKPSCPRCGKKLNSKESILRHEECCSINVKYLRCKFCPFDTKYKSSISAHIRKVHRDVKPQLYTGILQEIIEEGEKIKANCMNSVIDVERDVKSETLDYKKFIQFYCVTCDQLYEKVNDKWKPYCPMCGATVLVQCANCSKRCSDVKTMYSHLIQKCAPRHRFQCAYCNYASSVKQALERHINWRHIIVAREDYERCSKCDNQYKCRLDRINHERHCSGKLLRQCHLCSFKSKSMKYFNKHLNSHILHPSVDEVETAVPVNDAQIKGVQEPTNDDLKKRLQCSSCDKRFTLYRKLRLHQNYCAKQANLQCAHCDFRTKYRGSLIKHMQRKHQMEDTCKNFICTQCGKSSKNVFSLHEHRKYYCGKQPSLACDHCSFKTFRKSSLIYHLDGVHSYLFIGKELKCKYYGKESYNVYTHNSHVANCAK